MDENVPQENPPVEKPVDPQLPKSHKRMLLLIGLLVLLLLIPAGLYVLQSKKTVPAVEKKKPIAAISVTPLPTDGSVLSPYPTYRFINTIEDAVKYDPENTWYTFCDKGLTTISSSVGTLTKAEFMDLSENALTKLPAEIGKLAALKELILVDNNFAPTEKGKIQRLLPKTKIAFFPQKSFNPDLAADWKTYTNYKYSFSFKYNPQLIVVESEAGAEIKSDLVGFEKAYASCSVEKAYIHLVIRVTDNLENLAPTTYLEKLWDTKITKKDGKYVAELAGPKMIGEIKEYKNGELEGVIADAGESEHPVIVTTHNNKYYAFRFLSGGETGSRVPDIAKKTLEQTLSTFTYTK